MNLIKSSKIFFIVSAIVILAGIATILVAGLNQDIDFAGGTAMHVRIGKQFDNNEINAIVTDAIGIAPSSISSFEAKIRVRSKGLIFNR
ncbi:MAG: hypothetical protein JG777_320 [Clostridia bacterium]|nr:hypothetical protein [Clostridia bacterium]